MVAHSSDEPVSLPRTFLFTDIEGSYRQWERHPQAMPAALAAHDAILQCAVTAHGGRIFKTIGDAVCAVFDRPLDGVRAATESQRALHATDWDAIGLARPLTVRMALQTGDAVEREGDFTGLVLNRISRLLRAGHGGQVLLTRSIADELTRVGIAGVGLRDLGERRLRDVPGANRIYQLEIDGLPATFPPLETLDAIAHNLPVALNTCLDREAELAQIRQLLLDSPARLVTLLGPGGIGKTRLALHAATQLIDAFPGGVWFVDLSGIRDAALTPTAVAAVLGARLEPGLDPQRSLTETICDREMLLLLDNCEQIVDGAARFIAGLLPNTPGLRILATSRIPLDLRGEQRIDIGPLPIEKNDDAGPAVQLFVERAQQIRPAFEMTAANQDSVYEICRRVDGIPLALELAAARVAVLSPEALRTRLNSRLALLTSTSRDLPERHQTLRGAIEWSYALLSPEEQVAFRALSVFQGGWSLAGAQAVTGLDEVATMEVLASLCDKSLVRLAETDDGQPRYSMLETIQEYGYEQLAASGKRCEVSDAHVAYILKLTEQASAVMQEVGAGSLWVRRLHLEVGNIRETLQYTLDHDDPQMALKICLNTWYFWSMIGAASEGTQWFALVLERAEVSNPTILPGAFRRLGNLCIETGDTTAAREFYQRALEMDMGSRDEAGIAQSRALLGMVASFQGRNDEAVQLLDESIAAGWGFGRIQMVLVYSINRAITARNMGEIATANRMLSEVIELQRSHDDHFGMAWSWLYLAQIAIDGGDLDTANALLQDALSGFETYSDVEGLARCQTMRALVMGRTGDLYGARAMIDVAHASQVARNDRIALATTCEALAEVEADLGNPEEAASALGRAEGYRSACAVPIPFVDQPTVAELKTRLRAALGDATAERIIARNRIGTGGPASGLLRLHDLAR